jgi:hypothetical protein
VISAVEEMFEDVDCLQEEAPVDVCIEDTDGSPKGEVENIVTFDCVRSLGYQLEGELTNFSDNDAAAMLCQLTCPTPPLKPNTSNMDCGVRADKVEALDDQKWKSSPTRKPKMGLELKKKTGSTK